MPPQDQSVNGASDVPQDASRPVIPAEPLFGESMRILPSPSPRGSISSQSTRAMSVPPRGAVQSVLPNPIPPHNHPDETPRATKARARTQSVAHTQAPAPPSVLPPQYATIGPGFCALRLENIESYTGKQKRALMESIAEDLGATFICIKRHIEAGTLEHDQTKAIEDVARLIRNTDFKQRKFLRREVTRLRKERNWSRRKHSSLIGTVDLLALRYRKRMFNINKSLRGAKSEIVRLKGERDLLADCVRMKKAEMTGNDMNQGADGDVDGDFEENTASEDEDEEEAVVTQGDDQ